MRERERGREVYTEGMSKLVREGKGGGGVEVDSLYTE